MRPPPACWRSAAPTSWSAPGAPSAWKGWSPISRQGGGSARFRAVDVTKRTDTQALVDFAKAEFGRVDVLVNNAGVMPLSPMTDLKVEEWDRMIDVNIRGVLHGIAAVLPT